MIAVELFETRPRSLRRVREGRRGRPEAERRSDHGGGHDSPGGQAVSARALRRVELPVDEQPDRLAGGSPLAPAALHERRLRLMRQPDLDRLALLGWSG